MTGEPFRHSPGVFAWLSTAFQTISNTFTWLGDTASGILFVRGIASYFYTIDYWTWEAAIEFSKLDTWASNTWDAIEERLRPDGILNALNDFAHEVYLLWLDPVGWLKYTAWRISDQFGWFVYDPVKWISDQIRNDYPVLWAFVGNPRQYILDRLYETHLELYLFALDPLGWIRTNIGDVVSAVRWFLRDPYHFVHWQLLKADSPLAPFWADPWHTVLTEIGESVGLPSRWWDDPWRNILTEIGEERGWPDRWWEDLSGFVADMVADNLEYIISECVFRFW